MSNLRTNVSFLERSRKKRQTQSATVWPGCHNHKLIWIWMPWFYRTSMQRLGWVLEGLGKSIKKETNTVCYGFAEKSYHCQRFILCFFSCSFSSSSFILLFLYVGDQLQHWFQESSIARFISGIIKRILFGFALYRKSIFHSCFFLYHTLSLSKTLSYG